MSVYCKAIKTVNKKCLLCYMNTVVVVIITTYRRDLVRDLLNPLKKKYIS